MSENYQTWMERMMGGRTAPPLDTGTAVGVPQDEPFAAMEFLRLPRKKYIGEVGKKNGDYVYHFFPVAEGAKYPMGFEAKMGDAFLEVFKLDDRVEAVFTEELDSWAVKAVGFANNPLADELALKLFSVLDEKLED